MELQSPSDRLAEHRYQKLLRLQPEFVWREFGDDEVLKTRVFFPPNHRSGDSIPGVVFFHGGLWSSFNQVEFVPWALHLVSRGVACILPEYRMPVNYDVAPRDILHEARELWAWVRDNAVELGIDPARITVAGSDVGGLMALHVALPDAPKHRRWFRKSPPLPPGPACVALFRGIVDTDTRIADRVLSGMNEEERKALAPARRIRKGLPPLFASHGGQDRVISPRMTEEFCREWTKKKNIGHYAYLNLADHSYYHFNVNARFFEFLLSEWDNFMVEQGIWDEDDGVGNVLLS